MWLKTVYFLIVLISLPPINMTLKLWEKENNCPLICTCQLQHLTETAIYRFIQKDKNAQTQLDEINSIEFNDVFYPNNVERKEFFDEEKSIVKSAICILQTETDPMELINQLSENIEILTIIQGYDTGNKTIKFSYLNNFKKLLSLELLGPNSLNKLTNSHLLCEIDNPLINLKYLNFENILIKNSKKQIQYFVKEINDDDIKLTFEYKQKFDLKTHPLTILQEKGIDEEILPYKEFKKRTDNSETIPLFIGFKNLYFLRIKNCELNNVHWAMFDGLQNLQYLILEKNNLRFIPPFAFYGTPNLKKLSLAHNNLLDIEITDLAGLLELEYLDLSFNNFSQLSELSLPPFPKLKLANFANNPITVIFPNTFEVMNTTDSLIIGSDDVHLSLLTNSFIGLNLLTSLTISNLNINLLKRDLFIGMPNLNELILTGNIIEIEYDTFLEIFKLNKLILNNCNLKNISMDAFIGLDKLEYLDLSNNKLEYLPPGLFDQLINLKELYLNNNQFKQLPKDIFSKIHPKLIRLNENPWHCSCEMSEWKPMIINKLKQKIIKQCEPTQDKMVACLNENRFDYRYLYETKIAPKCSTPIQYINWSVFHVMRRLLKCPEYKPKIKKHIKKIIKSIKINDEKSRNQTKINSEIQTEIKTEIKTIKNEMIPNQINENNEDNNLNSALNHYPIISTKQEKFLKIKKYKKKIPYIHDEQNEEMSNII